MIPKKNDLKKAKQRNFRKSGTGFAKIVAQNK